MARPVPALAMLCALWLIAADASAQPVGTFRWQQQPYCNVIQVDIVQQGGLYKLDGFDDQCGATSRAAVTGLAFPNPDGSIGFGLTVVTAPTAAAVAIAARIVLPSVSGTWTSEGASGTWTITPGAGQGGAPRPLPSAGVSGGFSVNGGVISNLGAPTAAGDAATKGYVDAQDAAARSYVDTQDVAGRAYTDAQVLAARSYADVQDAADRAYADTQNAADRAYARGLETAAVNALLFDARVQVGTVTSFGCVAADVLLGGLNVTQGIPLPAGATLTAVRVTYVHGVQPGTLALTVSSTDLASGSPVTTTVATRNVTAFGAAYVTEVVSLPTPLAITTSTRVYAQATAASTINAAIFCGATPVYTVP